MPTTKQLEKEEVKMRLIQLKEEIELQKKRKSEEGRFRRTKKVRGDLSILEQKLYVIDWIIEAYPRSFKDAMSFLNRERKHKNQTNKQKGQQFVLSTPRALSPKVLRSSTRNNCSKQLEKQRSGVGVETRQLGNPRVLVTPMKKELKREILEAMRSPETHQLDDPTVLHVVTPMKKELKHKIPEAMQSPDVICLGKYEKPEPELVDLGSPVRFSLQ
ncbi:uncharacterized protein [Amphiura filiformis]|uniref:uncharacterized protein n=1 Tax=Amphiura filiformis TaxID=82378 RepID=UPI003B220453